MQECEIKEFEAQECKATKGAIDANGKGTVNTSTSFKIARRASMAEFVNIVISI